MPPQFKFTRDDIIRAALNIARAEGMAGVTARSLACALGCSVKPVFGLFRNMEEVHQEVLKAAYGLYKTYLDEDMSKGEYPPYKASGMAYVRFAKEEKELFKLLFMRDRSEENGKNDDFYDLMDIIGLIMKNTGLSEEEAKIFHTEMWIYVHGIATMTATSYLEWDMELVSKVLSDAYIGLRYRYCEEEADNGRSD